MAEFTETEKGIEKFKKNIEIVLRTLKKVTNEKDFRKAYREEVGVSINQELERFDLGSLFHFLRFHCSYLCDVFRLDNDVKIQRLISDENDKTRKHKKSCNKAPKLNVPRTGLLQTTTYPRRNPQGFNKSKPRNTQHPLTNLPFYKSNYLTSSHRPAEQLSTFYKPSGDSEDEEIVRQYTYSEAIGLQKREPQPWPQQNKHKKVEPPSVMNPFDFPSLPLGKKQEGFKEEEELEYESCTEYQGSFMSSQGGDEEPSVAEIEEHFKRLDMSEQAAASNVQHYPAIDLDDPLFRIEYPEVVTDPTQSIPKPLIKPLDQKIFFEVHIMAITSPTRFTFQYDDESRYVLMNAVTNFYSKLPEDDLVISARNLKTGLIVAVNMCNVWHRAQVLSEPLQNQVCVLFVDTGHSDSVSIKNIRYMLQRFIQYPVKSLLGSIAGIRPYFGRTWTVEACESFFDEVADKKVFATIRNFRVSDGVFELEIITKMNKPIFIAEKLCQQRHADTTVIKESFPFGIPMSFAK